MRRRGARIEPIPGGGQAIPAQVRSKAESSLGLSLSTVRIHDGERGASISQALGARAATMGDNIILGPRANTQTLAHELVHVAQTKRHGSASGGVSEAGDPAEREADLLAPEVSQGIPAKVQAKPAAEMQRDVLPEDERLRRTLSRRDIAGYGSAPPDWESRFQPRVRAPDPTIDMLRQQQDQRRAINPDLPELDGIELAQEWARDIGSFAMTERRRYRIDGLLEGMIRAIPREIWLPDTNVIGQSETDKSSLTVTGTIGPLDPRPIRDKLYTDLMLIRGASLDSGDPTGLLWDDDLGSFAPVDPASESERYWSQFDTPEPFHVNTGQLTDFETRQLRFLFPDETVEWWRREVAVTEAVAEERERRFGLIAAGASSAAQKFVAVALGGSALVGAGFAVAPGILAWGGRAAGSANTAFTLQSQLLAARLGTMGFGVGTAFNWMLNNPNKALEIVQTGVETGEKASRGELSAWDIPFILLRMNAANQADISQRNWGQSLYAQDSGEPPTGLVRSQAPSSGEPEPYNFGPIEYDAASGNYSRVVTNPLTGQRARMTINPLTRAASLVDLDTGDEMIVSKGLGGPQLGAGDDAGGAPAGAQANPGTALSAPEHPGLAGLQPDGQQLQFPAYPSILALPSGPRVPRYQIAGPDVMDDTTRSMLPDFDQRVSKTGLIRSIQAGRSPTGGLVVRIETDVQPGLLTRNPNRVGPGVSLAPSFNQQARSRLGSLTSLGFTGLQRLHLVGPGMGDEAAAGMFVGPPSVNLVWQNGEVAWSGSEKTYKGIEGFMRELAAEARAAGGRLDLAATAEAWPNPSPQGYYNASGEPVLKSALYEFRTIGADGRVSNSVSVLLELPDPATWTDVNAVTPVITVSGVGL